MLTDRSFPRRVATIFLPAVLIATGLFAAVGVQAGAAPTTNRNDQAKAAVPFTPDYFAAPYNGSPISHGLGPTYGETWCAQPAAGSSIANQQGAPLALIPYEAFGCLLQQFKDEAAANSVPPRLTFGINTLTDAGRTQYWAVVNAMETPEQVEGYNNWVAYRAKALTDPLAAQALLDSYTNVKIPVFMENNIHGDEEEGGDSMMQIIRDLTTLPRGTNPTVDNFLDHAILITIPSMNPDGRFLGQRANQNNFDMNRDWLVQSQPEVRANLRLQVEWLAPVMFATHGYVNPTLVDSLTKPHNPGLEYDVFAYWNQRRVDENQKALARIGQGITRPVNGPLALTVDKRTAIATATSTATTATITTSSAHGLAVGATVTVAGVSDPGYNGTFTVASSTATAFTFAIVGPFAAATGGTVTGPNTTINRGNCSNGNTPGPATNICGTLTIAASPIGLTQSGTTVTVTTTTASTVAPPHVADTILISGNGAGYNGGPFRVASIISPTQFTYEAPAGGLPPSGGGTVSVQTGPGQAEGWDDLGPFYTQTYGAFWGVDGSTMEMCSSCSAPFTGRLGSKTAQYVGFWSSADFWVANRDQLLDDQVKIFVRGVNEAPRPNCCDDPLVASRGFTEAEHDWMTEYPKAYIIPVGPDLQRSDAEANRMAQWVLDNGILLRRATADFTWDGKTYPAGSYVVLMDQPLRGLAFTALGPGLDYSFRINQLYAPPGGWSHGLMWGADTVEVPNGAAFAPPTTLITSVSALSGGVAHGAADWYAAKLGGVRDGQAILGLLHQGIYGEIAEAAFVNADGGPMPAGSIIFPNDPNVVAALDAAGDATGLTFQRGAGPKPATTHLSEAPQVGILLSSANPAINDQIYSLRRIFGTDSPFVSVIAGANSIQNAPTDPLLGIDVLYNTGQAFPAAGYTVNTQANLGATSSGNTASIRTTAANNLTVGATITVSGVPVAGYNGTFTVTAIGASNSFSYTTPDANLAASGGGSVTTQTRARLNAFFARGGGYIASGSSGNNLSFLTGAAPALVGGTFTQASLSSFGGTAVWANVGGTASPLTGAFPAQDYLYLPSNVTYFSAIPTGAVIDGQYLAEMGSAAKPRGPTAGYIAGLWLNRDSAAAIASNNAPVLIHGNTTAGSRYTGIATSPFSRSDFERIWGWIIQSALWSNLTDEAPLAQTITADVLTDKTFGDDDFPMTATASSGLTVSLAATGDCTVSSPTSPATVHITGAGSCTVTASQAGNANWAPAPDVPQTITIAKSPQSITFDQPASPAVFGSSLDVAPTASSGLDVTLVASGGCTATGFHVTMTSGTEDCTLTASQAGDDDYLAAFDQVRTVSPERAVLFVTPNPATPSRQYSDANPAIAADIDGYVNGDDAGDLTTLPTCSSTATSTSPVGIYPIECSGGVADNYSFSYDTGELTVTQEDAVASFSGDTMAFTPSDTVTTATVLLQATVRDSSLIGSFSDSAAGDIQTATVTFKEGATTLCGPITVGLTGAPLTTGSAGCSVSLATGSHTIDVLVDGNYTATTQATVVVTLADKGVAGVITGDGEFTFSSSSSAGTYAASAGTTGKFAIDAKSDVKGPKGTASLTYKAGSKTYRIELTTLSVLGKSRQDGGTNCTKPPSTTCAGLGYLRGTARLLDATGKNPTTIGTGFTVQIVLSDRGKTNDSIGFTLWNGTTLLFSSEWDGAITRERNLTKGNLFAE